MLLRALLIAGAAAQKGFIGPTNGLVGPEAMGTVLENFTVAWDVCRDAQNNPAINFVLSQASAYGYMGINFHGAGKYSGNASYPAGGHSDRDGVYMSYTSVTGFQIWDMWAPFIGTQKPFYGTNSNFDANLGGIDDVYCPSGESLNGVFTARFTRRMDTGDTTHDALIPKGVAHIQLAYDPTDKLIQTFGDWNQIVNLHCADCSKNTSCCLGTPPYVKVYPDCEANMTSRSRGACPTAMRRNEEVAVTFLPAAVVIANLPVCGCSFTKGPTTAPTQEPTPVPEATPGAASTHFLSVAWIPLLVAISCF
jgi:hypothetical protein